VNLLAKQICLKPSVVFDMVPPFTKFGDVLLEPTEEYSPGNSVVVKFRSGHPRNNFMTNRTFLTVELEKEKEGWAVVAEDAAIETKFIWRRTNSILGWSEVTVFWEIPKDAEEGTYRIRHLGHYKSITQEIIAYSGLSKEFKVFRKSPFSFYLM